MRPFRGNQFVNAWTQAEDELLLRVYPSMKCRCLHLFPGRTLYSLQCRMRNLRKREHERHEFSTTGIEWFLTARLS